MRYTLPAKYNGVLFLLCGVLLCAWYWEFCIKFHRSLWEVLPPPGSWLGFLVHSGFFILPAAVSVLLFSGSLPRLQSTSARGVALLLLLSTDTLLKGIICFYLTLDNYWAYYITDVLFLLPMVSTGILWGLSYAALKQRA